MTSDYVYMNIYKKTIELIISDYETQIIDYESSIEPLDSSDIIKVSILKSELDKAKTILNQYYIR